MPVLSQLFGAARRDPLRPLSCSIPRDETDTGPCSRQHRCRHSLSPVQSRIPASYHSPNGSALRANPCPEVTDPVCRLPLPTLFYRPEAFHLGDLLRIWVRACTKITPSPSDFQGPTRAHRTPQEPWCFTRLRSLSPGEPIPGSPSLTKKRELFPGLAPASPSSFASPHLAP